MAKKMAEVSEFFVRVLYRLNGQLTERFDYVVADHSRDAITRIAAKDFNKYVQEAHVYDSADAYHKGEGCLYFSQRVHA